MRKPIAELPDPDAALFDLGVALGQNHAFAMVAGRCSAAQAVGLKRLREEKLYKRCTENWDEFCTAYLKISRSQADRMIQLLDEFGAGYFEVSELTRISAETYRAIAPALKDGVLHFHGEPIELTVENSRKVAAAVAELRRAVPAKPAARPLEMHVRLTELDKRWKALSDELQEISRLERSGENWLQFTAILSRAYAALGRIIVENGLK
ncbi:MAG TPA: hypothetical protein VLY24_30050 [Bryobacteraceae bacterium]|nr:hypothetical protein [Bryobacteraceae bacterium]